MAARRHSIRIEPDPAVEGQYVTITVTGSGPWYVARDPGGELTEITPNANGEVEIVTPGSSGGTFTVTNTTEPIVSNSFAIVSPRP